MKSKLIVEPQNPEELREALLQLASEGELDGVLGWVDQSHWDAIIGDVIHATRTESPTVTIRMLGTLLLTVLEKRVLKDQKRAKRRARANAPIVKEITMNYSFSVFQDDDVEMAVKYTYTKKVMPTFEDPGNDAEIEITAVKFGDKWESPDLFPQLNMDALLEAAWEHFEEQALYTLSAMVADYADYDDR